MLYIYTEMALQETEQTTFIDPVKNPSLVTRRRVLSFITALGSTTLLSACGINVPFLPNPGVCATDSRQNRPVDISALLNSPEPVLLTPANTNTVLRSSLRSVALAGLAGGDKGFWIGYNDQIPNEGSVGFLNLSGQPNIENCGPTGSERIRGRVNAIGEHQNLGVFAAADRFEQTDRFGVYRFDLSNKKWAQYLPKDGLPADQTYGLDLSGKTALVATWGGVAQWKDGSFFPRDDLMPEGIRKPTHAILAADQYTYVGLLQGGLYIVDGNNPKNNFLITHETHQSDLASNNIRALAKTPDSKVWIGGDPGLSSYDPKTNSFTREPSLDSVRVLGISADSLGRPWVASDQGLLYKVDNRGHWLRYPENGDYDLNFNGLAIAPRGYFAGIPALKDYEIIAGATIGLFLGKVPA